MTKEGGSSPSASSGIMIELERVQPNVTPEKIYLTISIFRIETIYQQERRI